MVGLIGLVIVLVVTLKCCSVMRKKQDGMSRTASQTGEEAPTTQVDSGLEPTLTHTSPTSAWPTFLPLPSPTSRKMLTLLNTDSTSFFPLTELLNCSGDDLLNIKVILDDHLANTMWELRSGSNVLNKEGRAF